MPGITSRLRVDAEVRAQIDHGLARLRSTFDLPTAFPDAAQQEAVAATDRCRGERVDRTAIGLCTLDPAGSRDLDQAFAISRRRRGYRLHYAIADVAAVVVPGGAVDAEAWARGVTVYLPGDRVPLHPPVLSEGGSSLLPGQDTAALLWTIDLDGDGERTAVHLERALVRSRAQLAYADAQGDLGARSADAPLQALRDLGAVLAEHEAARGGVSLDLADQEVAATPSGYRLHFDRPTPVEEHNARLSLLTGMAAADLMVDAGVGLLRTLPPAAPEALDDLRDTAASIGLSWPTGVGYAAWIRAVDPSTPRGVAVLTQALRTFRGAGYEAFTSGPADPPVHAALAAPYAHATAPLRRLADRYAGQLALDAAQGRAPADWAVARLEELPAAMARATQKAAAVDRAVLDLVEAVLLRDRVGEVFDAVAVGRRDSATLVHLLDPAVVVSLPDSADVPLGSLLPVRLDHVDVDAGSVGFVRA